LLPHGLAVCDDQWRRWRLMWMARARARQFSVGVLAWARRRDPNGAVAILLCRLTFTKVRPPRPCDAVLHQLGARCSAAAITSICSKIKAGTLVHGGRDHIRRAFPIGRTKGQRPAEKRWTRGLHLSFNRARVVARCCDSRSLAPMSHPFEPVK